MFQHIGVSKHSAILMIILVSISMIPNISAQFQPELIPSEQICEQMEISNRLYNPVTIIMGYDKATVRTPEVIVSKSNPDAIVPIQILETNLNMMTNSTGRFVAKVDMQYESPSLQPRLVTYNIISGKGGIELERGTWLVDGKGFCKVITFTVSEEPHIPTNEEFAALAKETYAVENQKSRLEQEKTNDLIAVQIMAIIALICALFIIKAISLFITHRERATGNFIVGKLKDTRALLVKAREDIERSIQFNDTMNQKQRDEIQEKFSWFETSLPNLINQLKTHIDESIRNIVFALEYSIKNNEPLKYEVKKIEITALDNPNEKKLSKKIKNDTEFPKFVKDGMNLFDRGIDMMPDNPIKSKIQDMMSKPVEPETVDQWFEFYNRIGSREDLLKIYKELGDKLLNNISEEQDSIKYKACYKVLKLRE